MNKNKLPNRVDCQIVYKKNPIADLMLLIELKTVRKNAYNIIAGPSDQEGVVVITYDEIMKQAGKQLELALMDFDPIEKAFTGDISVKVMSYEDLKNAIGAYELFKSVGWYPEYYRDHLEKAMQIVKRIDITAIEIDFKINSAQ